MSAPEPAVAREALLRRIRGEFLEMPGLQLTSRQAQRLWGLDEGACTQLLSALLEAGFLHAAPSGRAQTPVANQSVRRVHPTSSDVRARRRRVSASFATTTASSAFSSTRPNL